MSLISNLFFFLQICDVIDTLLADPVASEIIKTLNPEFVPPQRPFVRLDYCDAIKYLNEHGIMREDGEDHVVGDDIAEAAERKMTDQINKPIMLINFPKALKSFYMKALEDAPDFTESVDVLVPGVGEVIGGSMRISDLEELMAGYKREDIPADHYYWFTDQRKYGTAEHGGYGLVSRGSSIVKGHGLTSSYNTGCRAMPRLDPQAIHCPRMLSLPSFHGPCDSLDVCFGLLGGFGCIDYTIHCTFLTFCSSSNAYARKIFIIYNSYKSFD